LHDLGVAGRGQHGEAAVGEQVEHLGGMVEADEVAVADHEERGGVTVERQAELTTELASVRSEVARLESSTG
jgi:hypothetical protein